MIDDLEIIKEVLHDDAKIRPNILELQKIYEKTYHTFFDEDEDGSIIDDSLSELEEEDYEDEDDDDDDEED